MTTPLRVLHLEDDPTDAEYVCALLNEGGIPCSSHRVESRNEFVAALKSGQIDIILADYSLPGFDGIVALDLARELTPSIPFLFVSATLGEELAIDAMHRGATDYILKQRLGRLVPSVQRALREMHAYDERKRAEEALRLSELQLKQAKKMEALGRLAEGVAHDFNNLLTVIMGNSQALLKEMELGHPMRSKIEDMLKAGELASALIKQLLAFSRKQPSEPKVIDLNAVLGEMGALLRRLIGEDIDLSIHASQETLLVKADPSQIKQIIINLVINARDAMPQGGKLMIETGQAELCRTPMYHLTPLAPGLYAKLSVSDTGCGMSPNVQAHMFEPFFTTKSEGKGAGLGLATVFGIVTQSGGGLDVSSTVGKGTRFDIYLPSLRSGAECDAQRRPAQPSLEGQETILLAEDDQGIRDLIRDALVKWGYRVIVAKNGLEACFIGIQQIGGIALLLTDVVMPGMGGRELAHHLRVLRPDLKLMFISGFAQAAEIDSQDSACTYLQKPFRLEDLGQRVRELLDSQPAKACERREAGPQPHVGGVHV